jgi:hypothetical protein
VGLLLTIDLAVFGGGLTLIVAGADHPHRAYGTVGWILVEGSIILGIVLGLVALTQRRRPRPADPPGRPSIPHHSPSRVTALIPLP